MVPAAPLLPTSDPARSDVGHWVDEVDEVEAVDEVDDVVLAARPVVDVDDPERWTVVGVDEGFDEQPASAPPRTTITIAAASRGRGGGRRTGMVSG